MKHHRPRQASLATTIFLATTVLLTGQFICQASEENLRSVDHLNDRNYEFLHLRQPREAERIAANNEQSTISKNRLNHYLNLFHKEREFQGDTNRNDPGTKGSGVDKIKLLKLLTKYFPKNVVNKSDPINTIKTMKMNDEIIDNKQKINNNDHVHPLNLSGGLNPTNHVPSGLKEYRTVDFKSSPDNSEDLPSWLSNLIISKAKLNTDKQNDQIPISHLINYNQPNSATPDIYYSQFHHPEPLKFSVDDHFNDQNDQSNSMKSFDSLPEDSEQMIKEDSEKLSTLPSSLSISTKNYSLGDIMEAVQILKFIDWHAVISIYDTMHETKDFTLDYNLVKLKHGNNINSDLSNTKSKFHQNLNSVSDILRSTGQSQTKYNLNNCIYIYEILNPEINVNEQVLDVLNKKFKDCIQNAYKDGDKNILNRSLMDRTIKITDENRLNIKLDPSNRQFNTFNQLDSIEIIRNYFMGDALRNNDRFLPIPVLKSSKETKPTDMITSVVSALNPLTYMNDVYRTTSSIFLDKVQPIMEVVSRMTADNNANNFAPTFSRQVNSPNFNSFQPSPQVQNFVPSSPLRNIQNSQQSFSKDLQEDSGKTVAENIQNFNTFETTTLPNIVNLPKTVDHESDRIINIRIPTSSGNNPIFEINLMGNGNIGILPVSDKNMKKEVPTISLQNTLDAQSFSVTMPSASESLPRKSEKQLTAQTVDSGVSPNSRNPQIIPGFIRNRTRPSKPEHSSQQNKRNSFSPSNPQIQYQTNPLLFSLDGLKNNYEQFNAPYSTPTPLSRHLSFPSKSKLKAPSPIDHSATGSDPNVYYIDITIPDDKNVAPIIEHGKGQGQLPSRSKRDLQFDSETATEVNSDGTTRIINYTGWHPVKLNSPLNNEPTVAYKPPSLQKVHFTNEIPSSKPLYPIVPKNPPVIVVRKDKTSYPEIDKVYGTEKVDFIHIEPKNKLVKGFRPRGNVPVLKFIRKLDDQDPIKRPNRSPPGNRPNFDISNIKFPNRRTDEAPDLDTAFSESSSRKIEPHPFVRILSDNSSPNSKSPVPNARGINPTSISPNQLLQARLHLSRLPLLTPLHGLFGSFTQIPLKGTDSKAKISEAVLKQIAAPRFDGQHREPLLKQSSAPAETIVFSRSNKKDIERSDSTIYPKVHRDELVDYKYIPTKSRFSRRRLSGGAPPKSSLTASSLSELLQIFKHINVTEPPPPPPTTPPAVTIMKGFRYTKPTDAPPTTTTSRPTTTKRFMLPSSFRYSGGIRQNSFIQNIITSTTAAPFRRAPPGIRLPDQLTPETSKSISGIPDVVFDQVAETNSLDGYLFSDSETAPEYIKSDVKPKVVRKVNSNDLPVKSRPKSFTSNRFSLKTISKENKDKLVLPNNSQPLKTQFEVIETRRRKLTTSPHTTTSTTTTTTSTTTPKPKDEPFVIIQGHSKVSVFKPDKSEEEKELQYNDIKGTVTLSTPTTPASYEFNFSTSQSPSTIAHNSIGVSRSKTSVTTSISGPDLGTFSYYEPNYGNYDYFEEPYDTNDPRLKYLLSNVDYSDYYYTNEPTYSITKPVVEIRNISTVPTQVPFVRVPFPSSSPAVVVEEKSDLFAPQVAPHFHFLESIQKNSPTSAVPTTWQDLSSGSPPSNDLSLTSVTDEQEEEEEEEESTTTVNDEATDIANETEFPETSARTIIEFVTEPFLS